MGAACLGAGAALAQTGTPEAAGAPPERGTVTPLHSRFVTATGQTVPRPDLLPPETATMKAGRSSYIKDRRIEQSI
jgi:hypothetical protein